MELSVGQLDLVECCGAGAFMERFRCGAAVEYMEEWVSVQCIIAGGEREAISQWGFEAAGSRTEVSKVGL